MTEHHHHRGLDSQHNRDHHGDARGDDATDAMHSSDGIEDVRAAGPAHPRPGPGATDTAARVSPTHPFTARKAPNRAGIRAVLDAYLSTDLLHSGPGLLPFGHRARERRAHNRAVAEEARRRRDQLRLTAAGIGADPPGQAEGRDRAAIPAVRRPVDRRTQRRVVLGLTAVVAAVILAALWWSPPDPRPNQPPPAANSSPSERSNTISTTTVTPNDAEAGSLPARPPIPPGGVTPVTPDPDTAVDAGSVQVVAPPTGPPTRTDLATPEAAMRAWLARLCPFTHTDPFGTAEQRARPAMTDNGWSTLNPLDGDQADQRVRASWDRTVAARESGRCAHPIAQISLEAPRTPTSVIVIGAATRVVTSTSHTGETAAQLPYVEQLAVVRVVRRGTDGLWRVDLPTEGG